MVAICGEGTAGVTRSHVARCHRPPNGPIHCCVLPAATAGLRQRDSTYSLYHSLSVLSQLLMVTSIFYADVREAYDIYTGLAVLLTVYIDMLVENFVA